MSNTLVFSGSRYYTDKKAAELRRQGYVVVWSKQWSDGKYSYKMEMKDAQ